MKNIFEKIRYWIAEPYIKKYLKKHIGVSQINKVISDLEMASTPAQRRNEMVDYYFNDMMRELAREAMKRGAVIIERKKDIAMGGENLLMKIKYWID